MAVIGSDVGLGAHLLDLASAASPLVAENLRRYGDAPLSEVLASLGTAPEVATLQGRDDLWSVIRDQATVHYGAETAAEAVAELMADPIVPTSNHFGVDSFADSVQGTLLFSLRPGPAGRRPRTVVVLGFGSISLNNLTYPMGLRLYDPRFGDLSGLPQRLPVFPNRVKLCATCAAGPFDREMVDRARQRLHKMAAAGEVTPFCERAAGDILEVEYGSPATLAMPSYGHQSTRINAALWRRMFRNGASASRLVQLQIEPICAALLATDLYDPDSLASHLFFDPVVRDGVLSRLDGARACWNLDELRRSLAGEGDGPCRGGTVFFWGMTERGRRVPLLLEPDGAGMLLVGVDERGQRHEWAFTPDGIAAGLLEGSLLPSLFTCFALLAFARGLVCVGGYYQVEYLPVMQRGVVASLAADGALRRAAELVAAVPTEVCVAGIQAVVRVLDDGAAIPAGPVEIVGAGGLADPDLDAVTAVTVRDAHLVAFTELFHHLVPDADLPPGWVNRLAAENGTLGHRVVHLEGA
jgi:hypothetical protein